MRVAVDALGRGVTGGASIVERDGAGHPVKGDRQQGCQQRVAGDHADVLHLNKFVQRVSQGEGRIEQDSAPAAANGEEDEKVRFGRGR